MPASNASRGRCRRIMPARPAGRASRGRRRRNARASRGSRVVRRGRRLSHGATAAPPPPPARRAVVVGCASCRLRARGDGLRWVVRASCPASRRGLDSRDDGVRPRWRVRARGSRGSRAARRGAAAPRRGNAPPPPPDARRARRSGRRASTLSRGDRRRRRGGWRAPTIVCPRKIPPRLPPDVIHAKPCRCVRRRKATLRRVQVGRQAR